MAAEVEMEHVAINSAKAKTSGCFRLLIALNPILLLIMFNLRTALQSASDSEWVSLKPREPLCREECAERGNGMCVIKRRLVAWNVCKGDGEPQPEMLDAIRP